ncbi:DegT/DnrJ/EryC1/StrS family aminotransferase [Arenicella xantha]|uniref:dTDP-4-amino-4,6-dideoxygalactose transaminase n=1 Tax=Arenicella xantha TaxID=644221 RepID=A0A395JNB4_9GAMM|nr:DegT/DnrJ/EryC1/StrS family aminotransferase [Arenicella xantha]RBP52783.1 dTDP-4-amino-4,6-dideoxygalactose transaminase [Arenicella xantha]
MASSRQLVVFGGLGFIGHRLALSLSHQHSVHVVDNACLEAAPHSETLRRCEILQAAGVRLHHLDIFDNDGMDAFLRGRDIDTVFHLAGSSSIKTTYEGQGFNQVIGITNTLLTKLASTKVARLVYFSSSMVYGDFRHTIINENHSKKPVDRYGVYKHATEVLVNGWAREHAIVSIIIRPTAVYGPYDFKHRLVAKLLNQARSGLPLTVSGDGSQSLDFTHVDDVVSGAVATLDYDTSDDFNISFGEARSINDLVSLLATFYPTCKISKNFDTGHPSAKRGALNSEKAIRLLGYEPAYPLETGLLNLIEGEGQHVEPSVQRKLVPNSIVPLAKSDVLSSEFESINDVLQTGWLTSGPYNTQFQDAFLQHLGVEGLHALTVNSCASALFLALQAHNITREVLVPAFTFSATINAVVTAGATPKFVDIESRFLGLDPAKLEAAITPNTEAILLVHLAGVICDIDRILTIAKKHKLVIIEDCAQALGAEYQGVKAGTSGVTSCFSFFPTKMITTGEGGMLVTRDAAVLDRAKTLANHGYNSSTMDREQQLMPWHRKQIEAGYNFRMSNINAAMGMVQLQRLDDIASTRRRKALKIIEGLRPLKDIECFEYRERHSVYQALNILVPSHYDRDGFTLKLRAQGVMASVHYPEVLPNTSVFSRFANSHEQFPVAEDIANRIVTLPLFGSLTQYQINRVIDAVTAAVADI